jgi:hypothetical protein
MKNLSALSPTNAAARMPRGATYAILSSKRVLGALTAGTAVPLVYWKNRSILHGVLRAAAEKGAAVGLGVRVRVDDEYSPRMAGAFRDFFGRVLGACADTAYAGPLFVRAELPYFSGPGDGELEAARRAVFAAFDAGFTSFSLKLPADAATVQKLPSVLAEAIQMELGVEIRHRVAGIDPAVISRILGMLRGMGLAPDVMRPLDGPQAPAEFVAGVAVGDEWEHREQGVEGRTGDARVGVVTMDALIASVLRSVLDDQTRENLRAYQEREKTGLEEAFEHGLLTGEVPAQAKEVLEVRIYAEFADALVKMGAAGSARHVEGAA